MFDPYPLFVEDSVVVTHWQPHEEARWLNWYPTTPDSFFDVVSWTPRPGVQAAHDETMRRWFAFVAAQHDELFPEWHSAHYFRGVDRETGEALDRYSMVFEYNHREGFLAYKTRRNGYPGPYAEYVKIDPFVYFDPESKTQAFWQPARLALWLDG